MKGHVVASILMLLGVLLLGGGASAQAPPPGPAIVWGQRDLRFNTVIAGFPSAVAWNSNQGARWILWGRRGAEVQLDFITLPGSLQNGGNSMPIGFANTDAAWQALGGGNPTVVFDPRVGTTARFSNGSSLMFIYLGGTIDPPPNQQAGGYVADIDLDVYYTGN